MEPPDARSAAPNAGSAARVAAAGVSVADRPLETGAVPPPDPDAEPEGFVVIVGERDRIHFLDWGGPSLPGGGSAMSPGSAGPPAPVAPPAAAMSPGPVAPGVVLLHGLGSTAWSWAPVARRLCRIRRVVAVDLRGHGLSDAAHEGYDPATLAEDVVAAAEGSGAVAMPGTAGASEGPGASGGPDARPPGVPGVVLAGHGYGAIVAAWAASALGERCAGLVLVDGGWECPTEAAGLDPGELIRALDEPPEVLRSLSAFLADREAFDPETWDADQERAARASVVELPVGRVVPAIHDHVRVASVHAMDAYDPAATLAAVTAPITALVAADDEAGTHARTLAATQAALARAGRPAIRVVRFPDDGHNLMRYRPAETAAAILAAHLEEPDR